MSQDLPLPQLVFFLEERSAKAFLEEFLPRLWGADLPKPRFIHFEGKTDMMKQLTRKLRGFIRQENTRFIILRDQDSGDCRAIKADIRALCDAAGVDDCLIRIACCELESWYLGDLQAVAAGFDDQKIAKQQGKKTYRNPDQLKNAAQELEKLTKSRYQKVSGSRALGKILNTDPESNRSVSFGFFVRGVLAQR